LARREAAQLGEDSLDATPGRGVATVEGPGVHAADFDQAALTALKIFG
jgi:hypothetical protein